MQQVFLILSLALLACAAAQPALVPAPAFAGAPLTGFPAAVASPFAAPSAAAPLAISSSQRLDYFNQFNAAFAPPARLVATPAGLAAFPAIFGFPAATRFGQPARLIAAAPSNAPFFF